VSALAGLTYPPLSLSQRAESRVWIARRAGRFWEKPGVASMGLALVASPFCKYLINLTN
jgi:hypothetical protein